MPVIELVQGSQEWLDYRKSKIMATDTPILLGSNPWKTKLELWEEKLGFREPTPLNDAMRRGQELEPIARELAEIELKMKFTPKVIESEEHLWLAASLDGISACGKIILEIKCPKEATHLQTIHQNIPEYYIDQMQHQLLVTSAETCFYCSYRPEYKEWPLAIIQILPDLFKKKEIKLKSQIFYEDMQTMNPPTEWIFKPKEI